MSNEISGALGLIWTMLGSIQRDSNGKISFPPLKAKEGLYKFSIKRADGSSAVYVGESDNIQRRFAHYRNPGPSQATNLRINALFVDVLSDGGEIGVEIVVDEAWIKVGDSQEPADFTRKDIRRLFENFVLATQRASEIENLNK